MTGFQKGIAHSQYTGGALKERDQQIVGLGGIAKLRCHCLGLLVAPSTSSSRISDIT